MAKRYYICRIIGEGTHDNTYNSELRQYVQDNFGIKFLKQVMPWQVLSWALLKYDLTTTQHNEVMANVQQVFDFPVGALDRHLSDIPTEKRNALKAKLEAIGFNFGWATGSHTIRDILNYITHSVQLATWAGIIITSKNFDVNTLVADIPQIARNRIKNTLTRLGIDTSWITGTHTIQDVLQKVMFHSDNSPRLFGTIKRKQWFFHDEDNE